MGNSSSSSSYTRRPTRRPTCTDSLGPCYCAKCANKYRCTGDYACTCSKCQKYSDICSQDGRCDCSRCQ